MYRLSVTVLESPKGWACQARLYDSRQGEGTACVSETMTKWYPRHSKEPADPFATLLLILEAYARLLNHEGQRVLPKIHAPTR